MLAPSHDKHLTKPRRARPACRTSIASEAGARLLCPVEVSKQCQDAECRAGDAGRRLAIRAGRTPDPQERKYARAEGSDLRAMLISRAFSAAREGTLWRRRAHPGVLICRVQSSAACKALR